MSNPVLHAEFLKAWADGQEIEMQYPDSKAWYSVENDQELNTFEEPDFKFRIKPRTININGFEVPEPVREPLKAGQKYWHVNHACDHGYGADNWDSGQYHKNRLMNGAVHLTQEAAELHARALLSFTAKQGE